MLTPELEQRLREAEPCVRARVKLFLRLHPNLPGSLFSDLLQEGLIAVMRAHKRFDPSLNIVFDTYARKWIDGAFINLVKKSVRPVRNQSFLLEYNFYDDGGWETIDRLVSLEWATKQLSEKQRLILQGYYFEGKGRPELSRELGVAMTRLSHMHREVIDQLREALDASRVFLFNK